MRIASRNPKRLGYASRNAVAAYEQSERDRNSWTLLVMVELSLRQKTMTKTKKGGWPKSFTARGADVKAVYRLWQ